MSLTRPFALVLLFGLLSYEIGATPNRSSTTIDEMNCGRFRVTAFADYEAPKFGLLLQEYELHDRTDHPKVLRSFVFPETQAEFDFRVAPTSVYCELRDGLLLIYGRGYDEGGDVIFRIRVDAVSWKYDFSTIRVSEEPK